jgi:hypothetical protein
VSPIFDLVLWFWPIDRGSEEAHEHLLSLLWHKLILHEDFIKNVLYRQSSTFHSALYQAYQVNFLKIRRGMYVHIAILMRYFDSIECPIKSDIVQR